MTQEQLAAQLQTRDCDVTRSAVAKMEVGLRHIYAVELRAMRDILNVPYETLLPYKSRQDFPAALRFT